MQAHDFYRTEYARLVEENNKLKLLLAEAADKFHILSFYIKDSQAKECCEQKRDQMHAGALGVQHVK
jgi:hypothetical protein